METTMDFIERLKARNGGCSNYRVAKILGTSQSVIVKYTKHGGSMDDRIAIRMAEELEIDPVYVVACMHAERSATVEASKVWERIASQFAACFVAAIFVNALFSGLF